MTRPTHQLREKTPKARLAYLLVCLTWGTTLLAIRYGVETIPPFFFAAMRYFIAGSVMMLVFRALGHGLPKGRDWLLCMATGTLMLSIANALTGWSEQFLTSSFVSIIFLISPFTYVALGRFLGEPTPRGAWVGMLISSIGFLVMFTPQFTGRGDSILELMSRDRSSTLRQIVLALLALFTAMASWTVGSQIAARNQRPISLPMFAAAQMAAGGMVTFVISGIIGEWGQLRAPSRESLMALGYLIVFGSWIGFGSYTYILKHYSSSAVGMVQYANTVIAVILGWLIAKEPVTVHMLIGGVVVMVGVVVVNKANEKLKARMTPAAVAAEITVAAAVPEETAV